MPTVRKLTPPEIAAIEGADRHTHARYNRLVAELAAGEWVEVVVDLATENASTVQRAFTAALRRRGLDVGYSFDGERIYARICEQEAG